MHMITIQRWSSARRDPGDESGGPFLSVSSSLLHYQYNDYVAMDQELGRARPSRKDGPNQEPPNPGAPAVRRGGAEPPEHPEGTAGRLRERGGAAGRHPGVSWGPRAWRGPCAARPRAR